MLSYVCPVKAHPGNPVYPSAYGPQDKLVIKSSPSYCPLILAPAPNENYSVESAWLQIKLNNTAPLLVAFIYRNPNIRAERTDHFSSMLDDLLLESKE